MPGTGGDGPLLAKTGKRRKRSRLGEVLRYVMPALEWLPEYKVAFLQLDVAGGLTLGCILVAQSLAHAALSNVNLINGPYSCILPPVVYAVFGTCVHSSVGTGGLVALLTGEQLMQYKAPLGSGWATDLDYRTHVGAILTAEVGLILALMGICKLAFLVRFLSRPALSGFITASAVLIMVSQTAGTLGLPKEVHEGGMVNMLLHHYAYLAWTSVPTACLSAVSLLYLLTAKRLKRVWLLRPLAEFKELVLLIASAVFAWQWNATQGEHLRIDVIGGVPSGLPSLQFPVSSREDLELAQRLLPGAGLIALVVFLSSFAGAKKFAMMDGYQVRAFNELLALGLANLSGALMGAVPTQIGLSRMGIAHGAGVKTQLGANVFVGLVVALAVQYFSATLYEVPRCVLNCIIISGASHLTEFAQARILWAYFRDGSEYDFKTRLDIVTWMSGFLCTLYFGAFMGILIAVFISLMLILYQVVNPNIIELGYKASTAARAAPHTAEKQRARKWVAAHRLAGSADVPDRQTSDLPQTEPGILVFRMDGPLFYANLERMQEWLEEKLVSQQEEEEDEEAEEDGSRRYQAIIFSASAVPWLDATAVMGLQQMVKSYRAQNIHFFVAQTFGSTGRILTDKLEKDEAVYPRSYQGRADLQGLVRGASSIDDFVDIVNVKLPQELQSSSTRSDRRGFTRYSRFIPEDQMRGEKSSF